jgi:hypothetical protein
MDGHKYEEKKEKFKQGGRGLREGPESVKSLPLPVCQDELDTAPWYVDNRWMTSSYTSL